MSVRKIRWRIIGSGFMWFWLAIIIRGSNQQVRAKRGAERGSMPIKGLR